MADHRVDDLLVNIQFMEHFVCLYAVLLGVQLKINVVEHSHRAPEVHVFRVVFSGKLPHDLGDGLRVLDVEGFLVVLFYKLFGLLGCRYVAHIVFLLFFPYDTLLPRPNQVKNRAVLRGSVFIVRALPLQREN